LTPPPTLGHIENAKYVLNSCNIFKQIWLMPCLNHMYGKDMATAECRLEMCVIAAKADERIYDRYMFNLNKKKCTRTN